MEKLTKTQWFEVATVSFLLALLAWLINQAAGQPAAQDQSQPFSPVVSSPGVVTPVSPFDVTPIGFTPTPLPTASNDDCGCQGCAAGSSTNMGIGAIVAQTNAYLASLASSEQSMYAYLAQFDRPAGTGVL